MSRDMNGAESFISHLVELRSRLVKALLAIFTIFIVLALVWPGFKQLYSWFAQPLLAALPAGGQMINTDIVGGFIVPLKVTAFAAFVLALPYVLYQVWAFVAPGLYRHEKRLALPLGIASFVLFLIGMGFAYFLMFPAVFGFMSGIMPEGVAWMTDIDKYFSFALSSFIAFGLTFEVPVVVIVLVLSGIVTVEKLVAIRPYVIVGAFVIAAIFTPPDVISQLLLAFPMCLLYELGIVLSRMLARRRPVAAPEVTPEAEQ